MNRVSTIRVTEIFALDREGDKVNVTQDGYITAVPRVGRIGIQLYKGSELGRNDMEVVRVWRPETEVMHKASTRTVTHRPVTNDHPTVPVDAANWKKYAVGHTGDEVMRDGEFIRVPMMLMDEAVIKDYNDGKKELSLGYTSNLEWRTGTTPTGDEFDAVQTMIRVNHLAVVDAARGGPKLAIGDSASLDPNQVEHAKKMITDGKVERKKTFDPAKGTACHLGVINGSDRYPYAWDGKVYRSALESIKAEAGTNQHSTIVAAADELLKLIDNADRKEKPMSDDKTQTIVVDGVSVTIPDIAASVVLRRIKGLEQETSDLASKLQKAADEAKKKTEEEEELEKKRKKKMDEDAATIETLKKQLADAAMTPEKLDKMVQDRALTVAKARGILGDKLIVDGKTEGDIRRQVVEAKMGDGAKGWNEDHISASFATLTADVKVEPIKAADAAARMFSGQPVNVNDREKPYLQYDQRLQQAYKGPQTQQ